MKALSREDFSSDNTYCFSSSERASGLWFEREVNRHRTPLEIQAAWEANEDEEGELKEFYEACLMRF